MMKIDLINAGKRFNREWIFRHFNFQFTSGISYAITGPNGSGKSTLLQVIATATTISEGTVNYAQDQNINPANIFKQISITAPYLELVEEMSLIEFLSFHNNLKPFLSGFSINDIINAIGLQSAANKQLRYFSSGMKQRVKLAQAIYADVEVVLLDEPCTNLDTSGIDLYKKMINDLGNSRLVIVSSNDFIEYDFCNTIIKMEDLKKVDPQLEKRLSAARNE